MYAEPHLWNVAIAHSHPADVYWNQDLTMSVGLNAYNPHSLYVYAVPRPQARGQLNVMQAPAQPTCAARLPFFSAVGQYRVTWGEGHLLVRMREDDHHSSLAVFDTESWECVFAMVQDWSVDQFVSGNISCVQGRFVATCGVCVRQAADTGVWGIEECARGMSAWKVSPHPDCSGRVVIRDDTIVVRVGSMSYGFSDDAVASLWGSLVQVVWRPLGVHLVFAHGGDSTESLNVRIDIDFGS